MAFQGFTKGYFLFKFENNTIIIMSRKINNIVNTI